MKGKKWLFGLLPPVLALPLVTVLYQGAGGASCTRCHEIRGSFEAWRISTHRNEDCAACHGGLLTVDPEFHLNNLRRLVRHLRGQASEPPRLAQAGLDALIERCAVCHKQEHAAWQAGPHSITYARIFLDRDHNRKRALVDDCLRCHGMYFEGSMGDLVEPLDAKGSWRLKRPELANRPVLPCTACHQMHRPGEPARKPWVERAMTGPRQPVHKPSLALMDRRQMRPVGVKLLPLPEMREGSRRVRMSPDPRQGLCYQCHAPLAGFQVGSGDDRTPIGVHEGISCLA
ncbi:MAG: multiheme c-type cytochrome, partial [Bryobacteraceae bacterium]